ncbi:MAG: HAMP domain-containing histidine kinase [Candidatus Sericytochromatia bacterium]|nr:HAMP domain-containing histidine kinase [Candidatus Tanganyikabacteria bacterium]
MAGARGQEVAPGPGVVSGFPFGIFASAFVLTILAVGSLAFALFVALVSLDEANSRYQNATRLHGRITHLDEVLTMSARMAAATGDPRWERRYRKLEPELDAAIGEAHDLAPSAEIALRIEAVEGANRDLLRMEHEALRLLGAGRQDRAQELLAGREYEAGKARYSRAIDDYGMQMNLHLADRIASARRQATLSFGLAGVAVPVAIAVWVATAWRIREWRLAILHHIAERKRMEAELRELNESLDRRVALRTAELEQANARLREADRYKDEFLSVVTHELKTPLNFIIGFESILQDEVGGPLTDAQRRSLAGIRQGSERMTALVENLLEFAKIKAGKLDLENRETVLAPVVETVLRSFGEVAAERGVALTADVIPDLAALVDEGRFVQVLAQLLDNAFKFTPAGGSVSVVATLEGEQARIEVRDTGAGIAPEDMPKLFLPFRQVDMSSTRPVGGTGLGLTIARAVIEAHGGRIGASSEVGRGTTVWFTLPGALELPAAAAATS